MFQFVWDFLTALFALAIDTGNLLETSDLVLFGTGPVTTGGEAVAGDLTAPTFTGYAASAIAAWTPAVDVNGVPYLSAAPAVFSPTNDTNLPQLIYGAGILDANGDLVGYCNFETPINLAHAGQQLHVTPRIKLSPTYAAEIEAYVE